MELFSASIFKCAVSHCAKEKEGTQGLIKCRLGVVGFASSETRTENCFFLSPSRDTFIYTIRPRTKCGFSATGF